MITVKRVLIVLGLIIVLIGTNALQFYLVDNKWKAKEEEYKNEINTLRAAADAMGPVVQVCTVGAPVKAGDEVTDLNVSFMDIPSTYIPQGTIEDKDIILGKFFKLNLDSGAMIHEAMIMEDTIIDSTRDMDIYTNTYPSGLAKGDYIDLRIVMPLGQDYLVLSHKRIYELFENGFKIHLTEEELFMYRSMLIDYYLNKAAGCRIEATRYVEPGLQKPAIPFYSIPTYLADLYNRDPNMLTQLNAVDNEAARTILDLGNKDISMETQGLLNSGVEEILNAAKASKTEYEQRLGDLPDTPYESVQETTESPGLNVGEEVVD